MSVAAEAQEADSDTGASVWSLRKVSVSLATPLVVGIVNVTPDSFSDGGAYVEPRLALERARQMVAEGAGMIDVGGESTRPGAAPVAASEEAARVIPIIRMLTSELAVPVSIDTRKASVARLELEAGAEVVNDVTALRDPDMGGVVAESRAGLVLMHMRGTPDTMQQNPSYRDVAGEVGDELSAAVDRALAAGVDSGRIAVDPGIGFAKNQAHNLRLLSELDRLSELGYPLMLGVSRKAFIGQLLGGVAPAERAAGTVAACVLGLMAGARIFRVHDVRMVSDALAVAEAIRTATPVS